MIYHIKNVIQKERRTKSSWDIVKDNLFLSVRNVNKDQDDLEDVIYEIQEDFVLVPQIFLMENGEGIHTAMIPEELLKHYGISKQELMRIAQRYRIPENAFSFIVHTPYYVGDPCPR